MNRTVMFPDPSLHPEWIQPHSPEWYAELNDIVGEYQYPWKSTFEEPTAEMIYEKEIMSHLTSDSRILDVGCGHGEFTRRWNHRVKEAVGIDNRENFIRKAQQLNGSESVHFMLVNAEDALLPFADNTFDLVYTKKGPWLYEEASRILKPNGMMMGVYHGGTDGGLRSLLPGLFTPLSYDPYDFDDLVTRYQFQRTAGLSDFQVQLVEEVEYLTRPEDVLIKKCFGQRKEVREYVWSTCLRGVEQVFAEHATDKGFRVINFHYVVKARKS
jgi:SAM-dependent methyltransferase